VARRSVRDPGRLDLHLRTWMTNWNDEPETFVWHKSADEIFEALAA
jgi:hypothetical protein